MNQYEIFGAQPQQEKLKCETVEINNGAYCLYPNFFTKFESDNYLERLRKEISWKQESMNMYGKSINFPRLTAWYGDNDKPYSFSGITLKPNLWINDIIKIKQMIEPISQTVFNSVLLNLYRDGNDSISWHTDAEPELGINPIIASVNFGETRSFQLRHINTKEKLQLFLNAGYLTMSNVSAYGADAMALGDVLSDNL
ncbi:MAG: alpha-ketoglutarate-dependent dioxygenase AlkB [Flavobacterium sp.]|nr:MAG: alpha-ketoglutarate-dependent dioxygenase AlkB [Flavobacterium sp.]